MSFELRVGGTVMMLTLVAWGGCTDRPSRLAAPAIKRDAAKAAVAKYDADNDGAISGAELDKAPGLKASVRRADQDGDGRVTADEIAARIAAWQKSQLALTKVVVVVRQNQQPLADAQVTLIPEDFLGTNVKPAQGTTDAQGMAHLRISADPNEAGVHLGYFRVVISKKRADGTELVPTRYNEETELGVEITPEDPNADRIALDINR